MASNPSRLGLYTSTKVSETVAYLLRQLEYPLVRVLHYAHETLIKGSVVRSYDISFHLEILLLTSKGSLVILARFYDPYSGHCLSEVAYYWLLVPPLAFCQIVMPQPLPLEQLSPTL